MTQAVRQAGTKVKDVTGGEMQSTLLRVNGIFSTGIETIDTDVLQLPLPVAQTLLGVPDNQVTQVALFLRQEGDSPMVAKALRTRLAGAPVEILTWRESMPMLAQILGLDHAFNYVMNGVVLAMVGLGILNTILMRVLERRYEFGVCKALGLRPGQLAMMIIRGIPCAHGDQPGLRTCAGFERRALFRDLRAGFAHGIQNRFSPCSRR